METRDNPVLGYMDRPSREALSHLLEASQDRVYAVCHHILGHPQDAEDAAQEVLLKIPGALKSMRDDLHFRRWLYRVSMNAALELKRKKQRRLRHEGSAAAAERRPQDAPEEALHRALASLEDDDRDLLVAHYLEKRTLEELARDRECSTTAVWNRLARGKERLKEKLQSTTPSIAFAVFERLLESAAPSKAPAGLAQRAAARASRFTGPVRSLFLLGGAAAFLAVVTVVAASLRSPVEEAGGGLSRGDRPAAAAQIAPPASEPAAGRVEGSTATKIVESAKAPTPAKESLSERLVRFRAWLKEQAERELREGNAETLDPLRAALSDRIREESTQVRALILADPETFLSFLKAPESEECLILLLALLCPLEIGTNEVRFGSIRPGDLPQVLIRGLAELIASGTATQRKAVLQFSPSFLEFPEEFRKSCLTILSEGDAEGQVEVLRTFNGRNLPLPLDRFNQVRRISEGTTDRYAKADCVAAMIFMNSKEVDSYLFGNMLNFRGMPFTDSMARAVRAKFSSPTPENEGAYSMMVGFALSGKIGETAFETLAESCLCFQPARAQVLLQQALKTAPSPAIARAIGQVLEDLGKGETSSATLRETFNRTLTEQRKPRSP